MLKLPTENITPISLLRSDRWLYTLLSPDDKQNTWSVGMAALVDYQQYNQRKDDSEMALSQLLQKGEDKNYSLAFLQKWTNRYLQWQGNCFDVKPQYLDEWQGICAYIDPLLILAWSYAQKIEHRQLSPEQLAALPQCAQALKTDQSKKYADNHSHFGGHGSHRKALLDFAFNPHSVNPKTANWPTLAEFSYLNSHQINKNDLPRLLHALFVCLIQKLLYDANIALPDFSDPFSRFNTCDSLAAQIKLLDDSCPITTLLKLACRSQAQGKIDQASLLLFTALFYAERYTTKTDEVWRTGLRAFIHTTQLLRASMIHIGVGLGYFIEFFRFKTRKGKSETGYNRYAFGSDIDLNTFREFKVTTEFANKRNLAAICTGLKSSRLEHNMQLCLHFTRSSAKPSDKLQRTKRLDLKKERNRLVRLFSSFEAQYHTDKTINGQRSMPVNLLNLLRGLDVAGNENELAIEVFAPTIRFLRACVWKNPYAGYKPQRRPHLSIHVGEDFKHLLSGLRHIDETVSFCQMQQGDRLGHALALGITPTQWAQRQGTVLIGAGEHLDNLVWLHHMAGQVSMKVPTILPLVTRLAIRIETWCQLIHDKSHTPQSLLSAWQLRRNCPVTSMQVGQSDLPHLSYLIPDFTDAIPGEEVKSLWLSYVTSDHMQGKNNKFIKPVTVRYLAVNHPDAKTCAVELVDYLCEDELNGIAAIQDHLMHTYDQQGIVIEACPSSNVYTGRFDNYDEHPIFRWNPPNKSSLEPGECNNLFGLRTGSVKVCLNTDDAGLFPTTIANEHRVMKETAIKQYGVCADDADVWIDRIRNIGLEAFIQNHQPL